MRLRLRVIPLVLTLLFLCSCAGGLVNTQEAEERDTIRIGFSFDSFVIERWQRDRDIFISEIQKHGAEVLVQEAGGDVEEQIEQIRYLISKDVDAIAIVAVDCNALSEVIQEAKAEGIYIISYDRLISDAALDLYISFDSQRVGELMAENMVENLPPNGNVVCINGSELDDNVKRMQEGIDAVMRQSSQHIISYDYCSGWDAERAYEIMQIMLDCQISFDGVICGNDDLANMVYKALAERGMTDQVCLVGQDADLAACQRIVSGWQSMTVYKPVDLLARQAAQYTIELIEQGSIETTCSIDNGYGEISAVLLEPIAVTADNIDEVIIDSGFHQRSEVYTNPAAMTTVIDDTGEMMIDIDSRHSERYIDAEWDTGS